MERKKPPENLYQQQHDIYNAVQDFFLSELKAGYVRLPTGVGKTVIFSHILRQLHEDDPSYKSAIITSRRVLLGQVKNTMEHMAGFEKDDVGAILSGHEGKERDEILRRKSIILTYPMLLKMIKENHLDPSKVDAFIFDEAHHALGKETTNLIEKLKGMKCKILGFTATPHYSQEKTLQTLLENEIYNMTIPEASEKDLISSFSVILANTQTNLENVSITNRGDYDEVDLQKTLNITERNIGAVNLYKKSFNGQKTILYCIGIAHADDVSNLFINNGVSAAVISSKTPEKERKKILEEHRSGKIHVLCNADLLIEGYDDPEILVCMNLRPTLSLCFWLSRGGEGLSERI